MEDGVEAGRAGQEAGERVDGEDGLQRQLKCAFYITGHGFGHSTRASVTIRALAQRNHIIHIITTAPSRLFADVLEEFPRLVFMRKGEAVVDPGVVQSDAGVLRECWGKERKEEWLKYEGRWIACCWMRAFTRGFCKSHSVSRPSLSPTLHSTPSTTGSPAPVTTLTSKLVPRYVPCFEDLEEAFTDVCLSPVTELPPSVVKPIAKTLGHHRTPSMKQGDTTSNWSPKPRPRHDRHHLVLDLPLVVRMRKTPREEVRRKLGIHIDAKVLLITFGGFAVSADLKPSNAVHISETSSMSISDGSLASYPPSTTSKSPVSTWTASTLLPDSWIGVFAVPTGASSVIDQLGKERFKAAPAGSFVPDLVGAVECVAGKCGYSTCAEVVAHQVPFVYVPRPQFAEEAGLLSNLMRPFGMCVEMPQESFTLAIGPHMFSTPTISAQKVRRLPLP
ncbi:hypothetical protein BC829DRAFT_413524 [Chytridium lagenaria]|nr:hypothetical protein BC829DRAFT_413524 [Chytridium lagenaria]